VQDAWSPFPPGAPARRKTSSGSGFIASLCESHSSSVSTLAAGMPFEMAGASPSDLAGLLRLQYRTYEDLCQQPYFGLPIPKDPSVEVVMVQRWCKGEGCQGGK
jgi:hypothetical protein